MLRELTDKLEFLRGVNDEFSDFTDIEILVSLLDNEICQCSDASERG